MRSALLLLAFAVPAFACGLSVQGNDPPSKAATTGPGGTTGGESHGSGGGGGADSGSDGTAPQPPASDAGNDGGQGGGGAEAGCPMLCGTTCVPVGTVCCTKADECPNPDDVCATGRCTPCGAGGTGGLDCKTSDMICDANKPACVESG